ncbi:hypothetical protein H4R20_001881 [Coemansia guatemalensis]|uniref:Uncharacterized protein n=1 Tax=Coemansia guatemalensis TaxID=2761395 RepID=A0A9W8HW73_9FUNG|nr:hypothetical protein H4R20_001881 [Coemansia guatemalensis]
MDQRGYSVEVAPVPAPVYDAAPSSAYSDSAYATPVADYSTAGCSDATSSAPVYYSTSTVTSISTVYATKCAAAPGPTYASASASCSINSSWAEPEYSVSAGATYVVLTAYAPSSCSSVQPSAYSSAGPTHPCSTSYATVAATGYGDIYKKHL